MTAQESDESASAAAKRLFDAMSGHDVVADTKRMSPELTRLVAADNACSRGGDLCEIAFDPWLAGGGQEGGISGAPRFTVVSETVTDAIVRMDYVYAIDDSTSEAQSTNVELARAKAGDRWKLSDLRRFAKDDTRGASLREQLLAAYPAKTNRFP